MNAHQVGTGAAAAAFVPAQPRRVAPDLDVGSIHLWWLPYRHAQGRTPLKALLAAYLGTDAAAVALVDGPHGRPRLATAHDLDFNWSHSGDHALIAVARHLPRLGVDIERRRARPRALAIAERFFAADEHALLQSLPDAQRDDAFVRLWTAKEAVLKAHGRGLAYGLDRVAFALDETTARPRHFQGDVGAASQWQFHDLRPGAGFYGTVAWRGPPRQLYRFTPAQDDVDRNV